MAILLLLVSLQKSKLSLPSLVLLELVTAMTLLEFLLLFGVPAVVGVFDIVDLLAVFVVNSSF